MYKLIIIAIMALSLTNCKKDEPRTSILGSWNCEEFSDILGQRNYQINIIRNPYMQDKSNEYIINNFHNIGLDEEVYVHETETGELIITGTAAIKFSFTGNGIISADFSKIEWSYQAIDGNFNPVIKANYY